jgi:hypothetical protein
MRGTEAAEAIVGSFRYTLAKRSARDTALDDVNFECLASIVKKSKSNTL